jgi:aspartyl-tRNA(Asn)/glutamyl-tRNA(Gln) amidotransferase subunit A
VDQVSGAGPAPSDGYDRRRFLQRSAALSAAAAAGTALVASPALGRTRAASIPFVSVEVRPEAIVDPVEATIAEAATLIARHRLSVVDLVQAHIDRHDEVDGVLKAFNAFVGDQALAAAKKLGAKRPSTPLHGIPLCIKDNYYTRGIPTTANSLIYEDFVPTYDATCVARLTAAGAIVLGKGQMGPLATTRATTPAGVATTVNAWTPDNAGYDPGGSSTGPATSVASRQAVSSIGTQTGGSIVNPSNQQGLTGLKPTVGRTSLYGVIPLTYTRDHCGPLARDALDAAIMLAALAGRDPHDPRTHGLPAPDDYVAAAIPAGDRKRPRVRYRTTLGVLPDFLTAGTATAKAARQGLLDAIATTGVKVVQLPFPADWAELVGTQFNNVRLPERSEPFLDTLRSDVRQFGVSLSSWVQGLFLTGDTFIKGQRMKHLLLERTLDDIFGKCDVVAMSSNQPFDIIGLPEIAFPVGFSTEQTGANGASVPVGAILGAAPYAEDRLLAVVGAYQAITNWHLRRPPEPPAAAARARAVGAAAPQLTPEDVIAQTQ